MTLEEEYENQQSWRTSNDKLTFIVCAPLENHEGNITAKVQDCDANTKGDVNFFLYSDDGDDDEEEGQAPRTSNLLVGEVDVMIASEADRGQGYGEGAVRGLLLYIERHLKEILCEYTGADAAKDTPPAELGSLMVKIKESNAGSRALFEKLGFTQKGSVNYFGEVTMTMSWDAGVSQRDAAWKAADADYAQLGYSYNNQ